MTVDFGLSKKWTIVGIVILISVLTTTIILNNAHEQSVTESQSTSTLDIDNGDLKINWSRFNSYDIALAGEALSITKSGVYHLTGSLTDQNIVINVTDGKVKLILDNVTIENSNGPAIACYAADDLVIELVGENTLSDGKTYNSNYDEDVVGAIYSKADLTFQGEGTLDLTANYQDGIVSKDDLKFSSGTYNITAADDGIRGKDSVYIVGGEFNIAARGDGIKSTNETRSGKGFILIENGIINITKSLEGIEGQNIYIAGGDINIVASDDGINVSRNSGILEFSGGTTYVNASGDGVDSNGYIHFDGGTVIVDGPINNGNGALDSNSGIIQTGGTVIAVGSSGMAESLGSSSSIYNVSIYFTSTYAAGTKIEIKDSNDNTVIEHTSAKAFSHLAAGTPSFKQDETYTIYINNSKYDTFTISGTATTVGSGGNMMPGGDGGMTPPDGNNGNTTAPNGTMPNRR